MCRICGYIFQRTPRTNGMLRVLGSAEVTVAGEHMENHNVLDTRYTAAAGRAGIISINTGIIFEAQSIYSKRESGEWHRSDCARCEYMPVHGGKMQKKKRVFEHTAVTSSYIRKHILISGFYSVVPGARYLLCCCMIPGKIMCRPDRRGERHY